MKPNPFHKFLLTQFSPSENKRDWTIFAIVLIALILILKLLPAYFECWYTNLFDPIISITTVAIAIYIWYFQQNNYWKESLPKRLTVHFMYDGKAVLSCFEAYLSGASDVRAWSQQIGGQMTGAQLSFYPYIDSPNPIVKKSYFEIDKKANLSKDIMLYEVFFFLKHDNFIDNKGGFIHPEIKGKYLIWLDNNPEKPDNISFAVENRPDHPFTIEKAYEAFEKQNS